MSKNTLFSLIAAFALITGAALPACGGDSGGGSDGNGPFGEGEAESEGEAEAEAESEGELYARLQGTFTYPDTGLTFDFNYSNDPDECPACEPCRPGDFRGCSGCKLASCASCKVGEVACVSAYLTEPSGASRSIQFGGKDITGGNPEREPTQAVTISSACQGDYHGPGSYGVGWALVQVSLERENYGFCDCPIAEKPGEAGGTLEVVEDDRAVRMMFHVEQLCPMVQANACGQTCRDPGTGMEYPRTGVLEGELLIPR